MNMSKGAVKHQLWQPPDSLAHCL